MAVTDKPVAKARAVLGSVTVNGNWRITFRFADGDAVVVDYLDYH